VRGKGHRNDYMKNKNFIERTISFFQEQNREKVKKKLKNCTRLEAMKDYTLSS
jgi:hypothetical protein